MDDVSAATWLIASKGRVGETYHISTRHSMSIRELVERLCRVLDKDFESSVEVVGDRLGKDSAYWLNSDKLQSTLGWEEKISLEHGLEATMAWVNSNLEALQQQPLQYVHKP